MALADEIASVEVELHTRLRHHPGYCICSAFHDCYNNAIVRTNS